MEKLEKKDVLSILAVFAGLILIIFFLAENSPKTANRVVENIPTLTATSTVEVAVVPGQRPTREVKPTATATAVIPTITPAPTFTPLPTIDPLDVVFPEEEGWEYKLVDLSTARTGLAFDNGNDIRLRDEPYCEGALDVLPNLVSYCITIIQVNTEVRYDLADGEYVPFRWLNPDAMSENIIHVEDYSDLSFPKNEVCERKAQLELFKVMAEYGFLKMSSGRVDEVAGGVYGLYMDVITTTEKKVVETERGDIIRAVRVLYVLPNGELRTAWLAYGVQYADGTEVPSFVNNHNGRPHQEEYVADADTYFEEPHYLRFAYIFPYGEDGFDWTNVNGTLRLMQSSSPVPIGKGVKDAVARAFELNDYLYSLDNGESGQAVISGEQVDSFLFVPTDERLFFPTSPVELKSILEGCQIDP